MESDRKMVVVFPEGSLLPPRLFASPFLNSWTERFFSYLRKILLAGSGVGSSLSKYFSLLGTLIFPAYAPSPALCRPEPLFSRSLADFSTAIVRQTVPSDNVVPSSIFISEGYS